MKKSCGLFPWVCVAVLAFLLISHNKETNDARATPVVWNELLSNRANESSRTTKLATSNVGGGEALDVGRCTQEERIKLLRSLCEEDGKKAIDTKFFKHIYIDEKHKLVACLPPRSGSTTFKTILAKNAVPTPLPELFIGKNIDQLPKDIFNIDRYERVRDGDKHKYLFDTNYTRVMIARHPFDRVYSAYVNKINPGVDTMNRQIHGSRILGLFHPELDAKTRSEGKGATFKEFVQYLKLPVSNLRAAEHWDPVYDICQPCHVNYDYIIKTETMNEDNTLVIEGHLGPYYRGLGTARNVKASKLVEKNKKPSSLSAAGKRLQAYSALNNSDIQYLASRFRKDFKYFGYSWQFQDDLSGTPILNTFCRQGAEERSCC